MGGVFFGLPFESEGKMKSSKKKGCWRRRRHSFFLFPLEGNSPFYGLLFFLFFSLFNSTPAMQSTFASARVGSCCSSRGRAVTRGTRSFNPSPFGIRRRPTPPLASISFEKKNSFVPPSLSLSLPLHALPAQAAPSSSSSASSAPRPARSGSAERQKVSGMRAAIRKQEEAAAAALSSGALGRRQAWRQG